MLHKQKKQFTRSRKEVRLMRRLRLVRNQNSDEAGEARGMAKQHRLFGRRKKKVRSTTHTTKKRSFLRSGISARGKQQNP